MPAPPAAAVLAEVGEEGEEDEVDADAEFDMALAAQTRVRCSTSAAPLPAGFRGSIVSPTSLTRNPSPALPATATATTPTGEAPTTTGGQLPRTGWDAFVYFAIGVILLLGGARLRVLTRIKQVVQRVRRRNTEVALREALEPIRVARMSPPGQDPEPGPLHVEPSTPTARRAAGVGADPGH